MSKQQNLSIKGDAGETKQNKTEILTSFEREIIGIIRKNKGAVSQDEIEKEVDKYTEVKK